MDSGDNIFRGNLFKTQANNQTKLILVTKSNVYILN